MVTKVGHRVVQAAMILLMASIAFTTIVNVQLGRVAADANRGDVMLEYSLNTLNGYGFVAIVVGAAWMGSSFNHREVLFASAGGLTSLVLSMLFPSIRIVGELLGSDNDNFRHQFCVKTHELCGINNALAVSHMMLLLGSFLSVFAVLVRCTQVVTMPVLHSAVYENSDELLGEEFDEQLDVFEHADYVDDTGDAAHVRNVDNSRNGRIARVNSNAGICCGFVSARRTVAVMALLILFGVLLKSTARISMAIHRTAVLPSLVMNTEGGFLDISTAGSVAIAVLVAQGSVYALRTWAVPLVCFAGYVSSFLYLWRARIDRSVSAAGNAPCAVGRHCATATLKVVANGMLLAFEAVLFVTIVFLAQKSRSRLSAQGRYVIR